MFAKIKQLNLKSKFRASLIGFRSAYLSELSLRIEILILTTIVVISAFLAFTEYRLSLLEYLIIILISGFVLMAELFNTALEKMLDYLHPEKHQSIAIVKDICAAAVLVVALSSALVGSIILIPKIYNLIFG